MLALGRIRLELLAIEVQEEKERIASMLAWAVITAFLGCFAMVFLAFFVTLLMWDEHRFLALGGFSVVFLVLAALGVRKLQGYFDTDASLMQSTVAELRDDSRALKDPPAAT